MHGRASWGQKASDALQTPWEKTRKKSENGRTVISVLPFFLLTAGAEYGKISEDENLRNDLINKILTNKNFAQEFEKMVDIHISDKIDRFSEDKQEKSNIGGFDNV